MSNIIKNIVLKNNQNDFKESKLKKINKKFTSFNYSARLRNIILVNDELQNNETGGGGGIAG